MRVFHGIWGLFMESMLEGKRQAKAYRLWRHVDSDWRLAVHSYSAVDVLQIFGRALVGVGTFAHSPSIEDLCLWRQERLHATQLLARKPHRVL